MKKKLNLWCHKNLLITYYKQRRKEVMTINEYKEEVKLVRPQMLAIARNYLKDNDEAEDAVQDDAEIIQKAQAKAKQQIEQLVSKLYPDLHIFIQEGVPYGKKSNSEISYK